VLAIPLVAPSWLPFLAASSLLMITRVVPLLWLRRGFHFWQSAVQSSDDHSCCLLASLLWLRRGFHFWQPAVQSSVNHEMAFLFAAVATYTSHRASSVLQARPILPRGRRCDSEELDALARIMPDWQCEVLMSEVVRDFVGPTGIEGYRTDMYDHRISIHAPWQHWASSPRVRGVPCAEPRV
jgi:hypothetical protein